MRGGMPKKKNKKKKTVCPQKNRSGDTGGRKANWELWMG